MANHRKSLTGILTNLTSQLAQNQVIVSQNAKMKLTKAPSIPKPDLFMQGSGDPGFNGPAKLEVALFHKLGFDLAFD